MRIIFQINVGPQYVAVFQIVLKELLKGDKKKQYL